MYSAPLPGIRTVCFAESLDLATVPSMDERLRNELAASPPVLLVDLSDVDFLDCATLGLLVRTSHVAARLGTQLRVVGLRGTPLRTVRTLAAHALLDGLTWSPAFAPPTAHIPVPRRLRAV